jgi:phosphoribosylformimino-5-aminoimidazole carboxamide ribotide isomerase
MHGMVVRGVAGRRAEYRPIVSRLTDSTEPRAVADAFRRHFGLTELYIADLDAIAGQAPGLALYRELQRDGFHLWVDAGVRGQMDVETIAMAGVGVIAGLETVAHPTSLADILTALSDRAVFSLDLRDGEPLGNRAAWDNADALSIANHAIRLGARRLLVLDLGRVGVSGGTGTEALCAAIKRDDPHVEIWCGGGVRGPADLQRLRDISVGAALVASALHDGHLTHGDCS